LDVRHDNSSSRQALLDAGVELLVESGVTPGVEHVKMAAAARRAGYTTGAAYRFWDNQHEFQRDVVVELLHRRDEIAVAETVAGIRHLVDAGAPFLEMIRAGSAANVHRFPDAALYFTTLVVRATTLWDAELRAVSAERVRDGLDSFVQLYEVLLRVFDRQMRPPYRVQHLALVLAALAEGFSIQGSTGIDHPHFERTDLGPRVGSDWTLLGVCIEALVAAFTEPADPAGTVAAHG
jgi:AcrR family transcriptional regulator